jgi:hypothetical protein
MEQEYLAHLNQIGVLGLLSFKPFNLSVLFSILAERMEVQSIQTYQTTPKSSSDFELFL